MGKSDSLHGEMLLNAHGERPCKRKHLLMTSYNCPSKSSLTPTSIMLRAHLNIREVFSARSKPITEISTLSTSLHVGVYSMLALRKDGKPTPESDMIDLSIGLWRLPPESTHGRGPQQDLQCVL